VSAADGCVCSSDHGQIIPLTPEPYEPERHIEVFAAWATDTEPSAQRKVDEHLNRIQEKSREQTVEVRSRSTVRLAGLRAPRVVVRYYSTKLNGWLVEDFVEMLRNGVEYSIYLRTKDSSYEHDRATFESVLASFEFHETWRDGSSHHNAN